MRKARARELVRKFWPDITAEHDCGEIVISGPRGALERIVQGEAAEGEEPVYPELGDYGADDGRVFACYLDEDGPGPTIFLN